MKDRKEYIDRNRALFDDKEPTEGHFDRFEALLNKQEADSLKEKQRPNRKFLFIKLASTAACFAILIGIGIKLYDPESAGIIPTIEQNEGISQEFQATNEYYNQQMEEYIADIMCKLSNTDTDNQSQLSNDLQHIIDNNVSFVEEMKKNENKEMAIHYLVKHYKANIQALENINNKLGKVTNC